MESISTFQLLSALFIGIVTIVVLTARYKIHAFYALLLASLVVGTLVGMSFDTQLEHIKNGIAHVMKSLTLIIVLGTALGVLLEKTNATHSLARYILHKVGKRRAPLAMNLTGFLVGLPIFCDSGYIVLSGLAKSIARTTRIAMPIIATSLAGGLYSVHCLIPPHPGMSAAAANLQVDIGSLILWGIVVSIPTSIAGYLWALYAGKKWADTIEQTHSHIEEVPHLDLPPVTNALLPIFIPIFLIALKPSLTTWWPDAVFYPVVAVIGEPAVSLAIGIVLAALNCKRFSIFKEALHSGAEKAGGILVIIGAGGAFGAILAGTNPASHLADWEYATTLGLLFPFLVTSLLKTAQGSSTVAIITASSLLYPLLPQLGFHTPEHVLLALLSMGAGSMMVSHANDAYFWVISQFSEISMNTMLKVYTTASIVMGITALAMVYFLQYWML